MTNPTLPNADELEVVALIDRLRAYRPTNEWGDHVHHTICDEAVSCILAIASQKSEYAEALKQAGRTIQHNIARAEAAEAREKRLREAISKLSVMRDRWNENLDEEAFEALGTAMDEAILAALSGGTSNG
jgi:hypothetical protein